MQAFSSFVPRFVARRFVNNPAVSVDASEEEIAAAVLFADISGFTALTERLARQGPAGAEELTRILNSYFGQLIDTIAVCGGDIFKFAGDALVSLWPAEAGGEACAVSRAAHCGLTAQARLKDFRTASNLQLSLRIGIGAGVLRVLHVGGESGRWEPVATGDPLGQMSLAKDDAKPGEVVLSPEAWALIAEAARGEVLPAGTGRLDSLEHVPEFPAEAPLPLSPEGVSSLRSYMPENIVSFVEGKQTEWLAELRKVTVVFTNFPGLNQATPLARAQKVMLTLQGTLNRYEGIINKLSVDDKGATLVAAFGLPPLAHEDDPERAVKAAYAIRNHLLNFGVNTAIGIATGQAFCGIVGNVRRREYTMIGDVVNLSARLMQAAPRDVLCDGATWESAKKRIAFRALAPLTLKGKAQPVMVYRPLEEESRTSPVTPATRAEMVGRAAEKSLLSELVTGLAMNRSGGVVTIEGEAGIGKSRLVSHLVDEAQARNIQVLTGGGSPIERTAPYQAWKEVFAHLLGYQGGDGLSNRHDRVLAVVRSIAGQEAVDSISLLNPALATDFPEADTTAALSLQQRAERANELLVRILAEMPSPSAPKVLVLEDAHWIDSASWALILRAKRQIPSLLEVISARPMPEPAPDEWTALLQDPHTRSIQLQPLSTDDSVDLVCLRLGVRSLPEPVAALIRAKTEGNPLYSEELAYALRDSGRIVMAGNECRLAPDTGEWRAPDFPSTVNALITSRIDRLTPLQQLTVKVASVIGRTFEFRNLCDVFPVEAERELLADNIGELERKDIAAPDPSSAEPAHTFKHILFQDVAYNLMLFSQRRQLHRAMANWLERTYQKEISSVYPLLAHHWSRAIDEAAPEVEVVQRAIECLHRAAEQALRSNANKEAVGLLNDALRLLEMLPDTPDRARKEVALQSTLGAPLIVIRGFAAPEVEKAYARSWHLCRQLGNAPELFPTLAGLWNFYLVKTQLRKAGELARDLFDLARNLGDPELLLPANRALGETSFWLGDPTSALRHLEHVIELYDPKMHEREVLHSGQDQAVVCRGFIGWSLWLLGYPDRALKTIRDAVALAKELGHPHSVAMAMQNLLMVHQFRREVQPTFEHANIMAALCREHGFQLWTAGAMILRGWASCSMGKEKEGIDEMEQGLASWRATGAELPVPYYLGLLAQSYAKVGERKKGFALLDEALRNSNRSGEAWWRAELYRLKGELSLGPPESNPSASEDSFNTAWEIARSQKARSLELRAAVSLGRLYLAGDRQAEGRRLVEEVHCWFSEGAGTADLLDAAALIESPGDRAGTN